MQPMLYGIPNCDAVKKARAWLDARGVAYSFHDYKKVGVEADKLAGWANAIGWEVLLNRTGTTFRNLDEADKTDLTGNAAIALMVAHPSLIKRPIVEGAGDLLVGFKPDAWSAAFG